MIARISMGSKIVIRAPRSASFAARIFSWCFWTSPWLMYKPKPVPSFMPLVVRKDQTDWKCLFLETQSHHLWYLCGHILSRRWCEFRSHPEPPLPARSSSRHLSEPDWVDRRRHICWGISVGFFHCALVFDFIPNQIDRIIYNLIYTQGDSIVFVCARKILQIAYYIFRSFRAAKTLRDTWNGIFEYEIEFAIPD